MTSQTMQPEAPYGQSGIEMTAALSVAHAAAADLSRKKIILRRKVLALATELAQASVTLADQADEIANFASTLPGNCGREEAVKRISRFIESLSPMSHSGIGEMIASRVNMNHFPWMLALTTTGVLGVAAILIAR